MLQAHTNIDWAVTSNQLETIMSLRTLRFSFIRYKYK